MAGASLSRRACVVSVLLSWPIAGVAARAQVDWTRRVIACSGFGAPRLRDSASPAVARPAAERAARRDARRACLARLRELPLHGGGTAGEAMERDPGLARQVEVLVRRAKVTGVPRYFADGGVALDLELPLDGDTARLLAIEPARRAGEPSR